MITMADENEKKIPVFTVLKNKAILKNIFVIDQPPPGISESEPERPERVLEEILMVGRHPDCNIMLTHPSISRFHLQIYSNPTLQKLSVMDLSSVHGTWVSEKKIESCARVELKEGDTIRLGASSRIYRLHWVPLSQAYDLDNPFVSASDVLMEEEKDDEIYQDVNSFSVDSKEIQSQDPVLKGMESFFSDENCEPFVEKPIPSAPLEPVNMNSLVFDEEKTEGEGLPVVEAFEEIENRSPSRKEYEQTEILGAVNSFSVDSKEIQSQDPVLKGMESFFSDENWEPFVEKPIPSAPPEPVNMNISVSDEEKTEGEGLPVVEAFEEIENQSPSRKEYGQTEILGSVNSFSVDSKEIQSQDPVLKGMESFFSDENCEPFVEKPIPSAPPKPVNMNISVSDEEKTEGEGLPVVEAFEEIENRSQSRKEYEQTEILGAVNSFSVDSKEIQSQDPVLKGMESFFSDENWEPFVEKPIPSAPPEPVNMNISVSDEEKTEGEGLPVVEAFEEIENQSPSRKEYGQTEILGSVNSFSVDSKEIQSQDPVLKGMESFFSDENCEPFVEKPIPSAPPKPVNMNISVSDEEKTEGEGLPVVEAFEEIENRSPSRKEYEQTEILGAVNSFSVDSKEIQSQDPVLKGMASFFSDENWEPFVEKPIPSAPPELVNTNISVSDEEKTEGEGLPVVEAFEETENQSPSRKEYGQTEILGAVNLLPSAEVLLETRNEQLDEEITSPQPLFVSEAFSQGETPVGLPTKSWQNSKLLGRLDSSVDKIEIPLAAEVLEEVENQSPPRKDYEQREASGLHSGALTTESVNSSVPDRNILSDIRNQQFSKGNEPPKPLPVTLGLSDDENPESPSVRLEQKSSLPNIWSRRGKPASVLQIQTGRSRRKSIGGGNGAKIRKPKQEDLENKPISKALFPKFDGEETEIFTPNKENFSPNTLLLKSMNKKRGILEETKQSTLCRSSCSKFSIGPNICSGEETSTYSDKENQTPQVLQTQKSVRSSPETSSRNRGKLEQEIMVMKRGAERVPFHSLLENAAGKSKSEVSILGAKTRSSNSVNCTGTTGNAANSSFNNSAGEGKRRWNMVVDNTCLLNKESRKSLQLLQGLKGTQLIIPRMVIRELDCLKRRGSLFRRTSEVSLVLQWVEECMVKTKWWIHVQSSVEEGRPIAPTPPASPSRFSKGNGGFTSGTTSSVPFSTCGSLMEIVSPTAEDHILECALFFRRIKNDGQLVLLTNDVTLKIKAMAEGLNCETVEEFRESLVNPFSERFMWSDSSPRGQTWSCLDDVVLREKYYRCPLKKASKGGESAKGLKLILLHNSHYGQIIQSANTN